MQPIYGPNFDGLMEEWCNCAFWDVTDSNAKTQLYEKTDEAASTIESLLRDGNTKEAVVLAKTILKTFTADQGFEYLTDWIAENSMQSGTHIGGAAKSFHHLANVVQHAINPFQNQKALNTIAQIDLMATNLLKNKSEKLPDFEALIQDWFKYAKQKETGTSAKMKLYEKTDGFAILLDSSTEEKAQFYAKIISNTFAAHEGSFGYLTQWIAENTLKSGEYVEGAAKSFHFLAEAVQLTVNDPQSQKWIHTTIDQIDSMAKNLLQGKDFSTDEYEHGHNFQIIPDEVLDIIIQNAVQNNSVEDSAGLRETPKLSQKAANAYQGPLKMLNILNEEQAIAYAKKFGKQLPFIDITGILFSSRNKFKEFIEKLPNLKTLIVNCHIYSDVDVKKLEFTKNSCPKLVNLEILGNYLGNEEATFIAKNFPHLQTLNLSSNLISDQGAIAIAKNLKELVTLDLSYCEIGDEEVTFIAENFHLKKLETLNLNGNDLGAEGAKAIVESFKNHPIPVAIKLRKQFFGDNEAKGIAKGFKKRPNIGKIDLRENEIDDEGIEAIAKNFKYLPNIKEIDLSSNNFGDEGLKAIAKNLKYLPNIKKIDLSYTYLEDEGVEFLLKKLKKHTSVLTLDLSENNISDETISSLKTLKNINVII